MALTPPYGFAPSKIHLLHCLHMKLHYSHSAGVRDAALCVALVVLCLIIYGQTAAFEFIDYDDGRIVFKHPVILEGFTLEGVRWAFTNYHFGLWMPMTSLSHMADISLFGLWAGGHHLSSVVWHTAACILLFLALRHLTGAPWESFLAAALFAAHPLRAEPVAWIAARKDLVSGCFFFAAIWRYAGYARRPSAGSYLLVTLLILLALMGKPMAVSLPLVLLILDWRPLNRLRLHDCRSVLGRIGEKIPWMLMVGVAAIAAVQSQHEIGELPSYSLSERIGGAGVHFTQYLIHTIYPLQLSPHYPREWMEYSRIYIAAMWFIAMASGAAAYLVSRTRIPMAGWLWFSVALVPVIGLVPFGNAPIADRFTYTPSPGILLAGVFGLQAWVGRGAHPEKRRRAACAAGLVLLVVFAGIAWRQTSYWRDTESVFQRILAVCPRSDVGHTKRGELYFNQGKMEEALAHYATAVQISPDSAEWHFNLGCALMAMERHEEALASLSEAVRLSPGHASARNNLGVTLVRLNRIGEALPHLQEACRLDSANVNARNNFGVALMRAGNLKDAERIFLEAIALDPENAAAHANLQIIQRTQAAQEEEGEKKPG